MSLRRRSAPACGSSVLVCLTADPGLIPQRGFSSKSTHLGNEPGLTSVAPPALCVWAAPEDCGRLRFFVGGFLGGSYRLRHSYSPSEKCIDLSTTPSHALRP